MTGPTLETIPTELLKWLKVHTLGYKMRYDDKGWAIDLGYINACKVIEAEIKRLLEEYKDDIYRAEGNQELLESEVSECISNPLGE